MPGPGRVGARDELYGHDPGPPPPHTHTSRSSSEEPGGTWPDRLSDVRPQERDQRRTVEQPVDSLPVGPSLDAPVPLVAEQLVDVLSLVAKYEKEMDRLEDMILMGAPVSAADRRLGVAGSIAPPLPQVPRGRKRRGGTGNCRKPGVVQFLDKLVAVPVVVQRHVLGSARGVPAPQTTDAVEEILPVRVFVEQIVVCQYHRSWEVVFVPQITEEIVEVIQPGSRLSTCSSLCNDKCLGRQSRKLWRSHSCSVFGIVHFLDKAVDTPAGVQRQPRGSDCEKPIEIPKFFSRCTFCPGSSGQVFQPSITKSSW